MSISYQEREEKYMQWTKPKYENCLKIEQILNECLQTLRSIAFDMYTHKSNSKSKHFSYFIRSLDNMTRRFERIAYYKISYTEKADGTYHKFEQEIMSVMRKLIRIVRHSLDNKYLDENYRGVLETMEGQLIAIYVAERLTSDITLAYKEI